MKIEIWEAFNNKAGWHKTATQPGSSEWTFEEFKKHMLPVPIRINYEFEKWQTDLSKLSGANLKRTVLLFDNGELKMHSDEWPFAEVCAFYELP